MGNLKRPKEFEELKLPNEIVDGVFGNKLSADDLLNAVEQAQKYAWNAAIKFAAKNAKTIDNGTISIVSIDVDRQSILNGLIND